MVLVVTSLGAIKNYPDKEMVCRTLNAFLNSLRRQTDKDFQLFITGHERPEEVPDEPWIHFRSIGDADCVANLVASPRPKKPSEVVVYRDMPFAGKMGDMSRKTIDAVIHAGQWAFKNDIKNFWMLRMDSDDLLWNGMVEYLHGVDVNKIRAVYNRTCHMFDVKSRRVAVHKYPYSTTVNAIYMTIDGDEIKPDWFFHCHDHSTFVRMCAIAEIPAVEMDFTLCITTNSGNSISNRPEIEKEKNTRLIDLDPDVVERYGLAQLFV